MTAISVINPPKEHSKTIIHSPLSSCFLSRMNLIIPWYKQCPITKLYIWKYHISRQGNLIKAKKEVWKSAFFWDEISISSQQQKLFEITSSFALLWITLLFHDGGRYHIDTSPLICGANDDSLCHERVKFYILYESWSFGQRCHHLG